MSEDWKPGDLAIVINHDHIACPNPSYKGSHKGWNLKGMRFTFITSREQIIKCGCKVLEMDNGKRGLVQRFRKVPPHTPDKFDEEIIETMKPKYEFSKRGKVVKYEPARKSR